uniref:Mesothelin like n=1 Tax=Monodelphis domestica TaxID=13616 RepID=F6QGD8_MONDO
MILILRKVLGWSPDGLWPGSWRVWPQQPGQSPPFLRWNTFCCIPKSCPCSLGLNTFQDEYSILRGRSFYGLSWLAGSNPTMGNSIIPETITTEITTKGNCAITETITVESSAITGTYGTPDCNITMGNSASTENNGTSDNNTSGFNIISETKHSGNNDTQGSNAITGNNTTTETKTSRISNIKGNNIDTENNILLGNKAQGISDIARNATGAGISVILGNKTLENSTSTGNNVTTRNQISQSSAIQGNTTTANLALENRGILGNSSVLENKVPQNHDIKRSNFATGTKATRNNDILGTIATTLENVSVGIDSLEIVTSGNIDSVGSNSTSQTRITSESKTLENTITESRTALGSSSTPGNSHSILENKLTTEKLDILGNKTSETVTWGTDSSENNVSMGISEDTLGSNATTGNQISGITVSMGNVITENKALGNNITTLEEDTLCLGSGINETILCGGELSPGEHTEDISLRDFICNKRAQGSKLNREELEGRLGRAQCEDPGITETLTLIFSYANLTELQGALGKLNDSACHEATVKALWTVMLQGRLDFQDTLSLRWWFQGLLQPFLASLPREDLRCLPLSTLGCEQYQAIVQGLDMEFEGMSQETREAVYTTFQLPVLTRLSGLTCVPEMNSSAAWLDINLGHFSQYATYGDLVAFNSQFDGLQALDHLTLRQLAQLVATKGALNETALGEFPKSFCNQEPLPNGTKEAVETSLSLLTNGSVSVGTWTDVRTLFYFYFLQSEFLPTVNTSCPAFQAIVRNGPSILKGREEEVYHHIYSFLTGTLSRPRCYNPSDPLSPGWFSAYLGPYVHLSSVDDIRDFLGYDQQLLQTLASQQDSLQLFSQQDVPRNVMWLLTSALLAKTPNFTILELPDKLLCFSLEASALHFLGEEALWRVIKRLNDNCGSSNRTDPDAWGLRVPLPPARRLATLLVSEIPAFNQSILVALGQQAVGLTAGQIMMLSEDDVAASVQALGRVIGWDKGQAYGLVSKLTAEQLLADKLETLGSLVPGLPSSVLCALSAENASHLASIPTFLCGLRDAPTYLKRVFTDRIVLHPLPISRIVEIVPPELVPQIPSSFLLWDNLTEANLSTISKQPWEPAQASGFFQQGLASSVGNHVARLSASILQGFQCQEASQLTRDQFSSLVREVQKQKAILNARQLSCMANLLALHNLTDNFAEYPPDLLLFYDLRKVDGAKCREFISRASQGNLNLLSGLSAQKRELLNVSQACLGNPGTNLSKEDLTYLGGLVCDMEPAVILESDPHILDNLKHCAQLTAGQQDALNTLLHSGTTSLGTPGSWNLGKLWSLGPLAFYINPILWKMVNKDVSKDFFRDVVARYQAGSLPRSHVQNFVDSFLAQELSASRTSQMTGKKCYRGNITAQVIQDELFMVRYDCKQLKTCLGSKVLKANLHPLLQHPLPRECQRVVKGKLGEIYPRGVPEDQLKLIASLVYLYSNDEISHWNITSGDTVVALLGSDVAMENQTQAVIKKYLELNGTVTGALLVAIGGFRLCWMSPRQIEAIRPMELRRAGALDISSCAQERKDDLYEKAKKAFPGSNGTITYYHYIRPYLGGAPLEDLKLLARTNISMDIDTFTSLNPEVLQNLSLSNVATLLGRNVADLRKARSNPSVKVWLENQNQSALEALGLDRTPDKQHPSPATTGKPGPPWITGKGHNSSASPNGHISSTTPSGSCVLAPLHFLNVFGLPIGLTLLMSLL